MSTCLHVLFCCISHAQEHSNTPAVAALGSLSLDSGTTWLHHVFDARIHDSVQIIGLGEVSHGGFEPMAFKAKMIQYLVEKRGYRKVLFELSDFETIMAVRDDLNSSRAGDPNLEDPVMKRISHLPAGDKVLRLLFHWLKLYNLKHPTDRVQIGGFDLVNGSWICNYILYKYIIPIDPGGAKKVIYQLNYSGASDSARSQSISCWFRAHATMLKAKLDNKDLNRLDFLVRNTEYTFLQPVRESEEQSKMYRDSIMAKNIKELAGSTKTIVWAHSGHISPWNPHLMGAYLEQYYRSRYFTLVTDFSQIATVDVLNRQKSVSDSGFVFQKSFTSSSTTAANTLFRRYGIPDGIIFRTDIIKYKVPLEVNLIDVYGAQTRMTSERAFDVLVFFDEIHPDPAITHKSQL